MVQMKTFMKGWLMVVYEGFREQTREHVAPRTHSSLSLILYIATLAAMGLLLSFWAGEVDKEEQ